MKRWIWVAFPLTVLTGFFLLQPPRAAGDEALPSFALERMDGQTVNLTDFKGKPIVLNAWATWCAPCRREMPMLVYAAEANPDVSFVFLNISDSPEAVRAFEDEINLKIPNVLLDRKASLSDSLKIRGLPVTLFYDIHGKLVNRHVGEIKAAELEQLLEGF